MRRAGRIANRVKDVWLEVVQDMKGHPYWMRDVLTIRNVAVLKSQMEQAAGGDAHGRQGSHGAPPGDDDDGARAELIGIDREAPGEPSRPSDDCLARECLQPQDEEVLGYIWQCHKYPVGKEREKHDYPNGIEERADTYAHLPDENRS